MFWGSFSWKCVYLSLRSHKQALLARLLLWEDITPILAGCWKLLLTDSSQVLAEKIWAINFLKSALFPVMYPGRKVLTGLWRSLVIILKYSYFILNFITGMKPPTRRGNSSKGLRNQSFLENQANPVISTDFSKGGFPQFVFMLWLKSHSCRRISSPATHINWKVIIRHSIKWRNGIFSPLVTSLLFLSQAQGHLHWLFAPGPCVRADSRSFLHHLWLQDRLLLSSHSLRPGEGWQSKVGANSASAASSLLAQLPPSVKKCWCIRHTSEM